jgi:hypothetical protein
MKGNFSIGSLLMNFAVAGYLIATGILGFGKAKWISSFNPEIRQAVEAVFKSRDFKDFNEVLITILSVLAIAAGVFILMRLFDVTFPSIDLILIILAIVWLAFIVMIDIITPINSNKDFNFIDWLSIFCPHLMVLAGIALATDRFGGK